MGCKPKKSKCGKNKIKKQNVHNSNKGGKNESDDIYIYRMDHDTGFAPNTKYGICTLSGCKKRKKDGTRNIEELAKKGSWVIGIGGKDTNQSNKLIYAMEVEENLRYFQFKKRYYGKHNEYLRQKKLKRGKHGTNVLVSHKFYYFGNNAVDFPKKPKRIIIKGRSFKHLRGDEELDKPGINELEKFKKRLLNKYKHYGVFGKPNNLSSSKMCKKC